MFIYDMYATVFTISDSTAVYCTIIPWVPEKRKKKRRKENENNHHVIEYMISL